ncbi:acyltransferase domain-containing protein [Acinetobacter pseudolwoffii]|uniref:acyltransferase domain-containing protein n=1 Tax=Acinetobacter pseudolwoffii TaxID=2053287 RepID=UPI00207B697F|nr:acyltransferase domain-containing protein [Acinetobacter pseudolwoffii]
MAKELQVVDELKLYLPKLFCSDLTEADLYPNEFAQPFIFALQWCRWQKLKPEIEDLMSFSGYSLGELSALICATQTGLEQGLYLAQQRASLMSSATQHASGLMAVQGINLNTLEPLLTETATALSIKLSDSSFVVGGANANLQQLAQQLELRGTRFVKRLNVTIASHTVCMDAAVQPYRQVLQQQDFARLCTAMISGSGGHKFFKTTDAVNALIHQMNHAIDWDACLTAIQENQPDVVLEIGPGNALSKMLLERSPNCIVRAVDDFKSWSGLLVWLDKQSRM